MPSHVKALLPLGLFLLVVLVLGFALSRDPARLPTEMLDRPFPDFTLSTLFDPDDIITEDVIQGEITLINVFGSWCSACVQEHPKLMEIGRRGEIRLIGLDWRDTREKGRRWIERYGNPYDVILFDDSSQLAIDLGVTGAPETYVMDKHGTIRYKHVGIITDRVWAKTLRPLIRALEAET